MAIYVVMEPPAATEAEAIERAVLVRDGFAVLAFLVPPLWLFWHRLWIEALLALAASIALATLGEQAGLGFSAPACRSWCRSTSVSRARRCASRSSGVAAGANGACSKPAMPPRPKFAIRRRIGEDDVAAAGAPCPPHRGFHASADPSHRTRARPVRLSGQNLMRVAIIDYGSGNLRSATKAFERAARESGHRRGDRLLTADADVGAHRRPHRAAWRRRLCRLRGRAARRAGHVGGGRGGGDPQGPAVPRHLRRHAADVRARAGEDRHQRASAGSRAT